MKKLLFPLLLAASAGFLAFRISRHDVLSTSLMALLPAEQQDPVFNGATDAFFLRSARTLLVLVSAPDAEAAAGAADAAAALFRASPRIESVSAGQGPEKESAFLSFYFPYRHAMLSSNDRTLLRSPDAFPRFMSRAAENLYAPFRLLPPEDLAADPLAFFASLADSWAAGVPAVGGKPGDTLLMLELAGDPFDAGVQEDAADLMASARVSLSAAVPGSTLSWTGLLPFARAERRRMQSETVLIGAASTLGIAFLALWVFRSPRPLALGYFSVACGLLTGTAAVLAVFGRIHGLTVAFGSSLLGAAVDYALHYAAHHRLPDVPWNSEKALAAIRPSLILGTLTGVISYAALGMTPLPGLRQMALFSSVGLATSLWAVLAAGPVFLRAPGRPAPPPSLLGVMDAAARFWGRWRGRRAALPAAVAALFLVSVAACFKVRFDDNPSRLQRPSSALLAEDAVVRRAAGSQELGRLAIVHGTTQEEVLRRQEVLGEALSALAAEGKVVSFRGLAPFLPSAARMAENRGLLKDVFLPKAAALRGGLASLGFPAGAAKEFLQDIGSPLPAFSLAQWLASPVSEGLRNLWLGETPRGFFAVALLGGVSDEAAVRARLDGLAGVRYHNKAAEYTGFLKQYRRRALGLVAAAYALILGVMVFRYGFSGGAAVTLPCLFSGLLTALVLPGPLNLMHVLGMVLVLGMAVDYAIFFAESAQRGEGVRAAGLGISLSTLTTALSFGFLALSGAPALRALGSSVSAGMLFAFLFSPMPLMSLGKKDA